MCFGGKKSSTPPPVPAPTPPTQFGYVSADYSNEKQKKAAVVSATQAGQQPASFGSELGTAGGTTGTSGTVPAGG